jgi:hypothetical protein
VDLRWTLSADSDQYSWRRREFDPQPCGPFVRRCDPRLIDSLRSWLVANFSFSSGHAGNVNRTNGQSRKVADHYRHARGGFRQLYRRAHLRRSVRRRDLCADQRNVGIQYWLGNTLNQRASHTRNWPRGWRRRHHSASRGQRSTHFLEVFWRRRDTVPDRGHQEGAPDLPPRSATRIEVRPPAPSQDVSLSSPGRDPSSDRESAFPQAARAAGRYWPLRRLAVHASGRDTDQPDVPRSTTWCHRSQSNPEA